MDKSNAKAQKNKKNTGKAKNTDDNNHNYLADSGRVEGGSTRGKKN